MVFMAEEKTIEYLLWRLDNFADNLIKEGTYFKEEAVRLRKYARKRNLLDRGKE